MLLVGSWLDTAVLACCFLKESNPEDKWEATWTSPAATALQVGQTFCLGEGFRPIECHLVYSCCLFCSFFSTYSTCSHLASTLYTLSIFFSHFVSEIQTEMHLETLTQTHKQHLMMCWNVFGVELLLMCLFFSPAVNALLYWLSFPMTAVLQFSAVCMCVCPYVQSLTVVQCRILPGATLQHWHWQAF